MKRRIVALAFLVAGCGGGSHSGGSNKPLEATRAVARQVLATGLDQPMQYIAVGKDTRIAYVLERAGRVRVLVDEVLGTAPVLDISSKVVTDGECGLQGMTLAPDYATSRHFYLQFNTTENGAFQTRVSRFTMSADGLSASGETPIFRIDQPYNNHKGGTIHFADDGFLYLALGDGGAGNDPGNRAQDPTQLLGKVLRIDPSGDDFPADVDQNYRVPSSNPFVGTSGVRGEIWDLGMRNPFRWSIDSKTKGLIFADVGQDLYEEIDFEPAGTGGRNYGWRLREGLHGTSNGGAITIGTLTEPFLEYDHAQGYSVTGGYVDREGSVDLRDRYLFADYIANRMWALPFGNSPAPSTLASTTELTVEGGWNGIVAIDPDGKGRPIITELNAGTVSRLVAVP